jgi:hypothetical protein
MKIIANNVVFGNLIAISKFWRNILPQFRDHISNLVSDLVSQIINPNNKNYGALQMEFILRKLDEM